MLSKPSQLPPVGGLELLGDLAKLKRAALAQGMDVQGCAHPSTLITICHARLIQPDFRQGRVSLSQYPTAARSATPTLAQYTIQ
jgi:hypothetical protein